MLTEEDARWLVKQMRENRYEYVAVLAEKHTKKPNESLLLGFALYAASN